MLKKSRPSELGIWENLNIGTIIVSTVADCTALTFLCGVYSRVYQLSYSIQSPWWFKVDLSEKEYEEFIVFPL